MGTRPTRKAGIYKPRTVSDPQVLKALNSIIERLEVLDGIRGDNLDQAITWRDLGNTGFTLGQGAGGTPTITNTPGPGTPTGGVPVPTIGPADPPTGLTATETYLALLLSWTNSALNLQHVEIWRNDVSIFAGAVLIATTSSNKYVDYVGANRTYYYWVRSVGTDGTYSAYYPSGINDGIQGVTGIDPGNIDLTIDAANFKLIDGVDVLNPFLVGTLPDDSTGVALDGSLIIKESIRAETIVGKTIGADQLVGNSLTALYADLGSCYSGLFSTREQGSTGFRVEIADITRSPTWPLWYGSGPKADAGGLFYVTSSGDVVVRGLLDAGMIRQSFFTPSSPGEDQFKIATQFFSNPSSYSGGSYTGKKAHLFPMKTAHYGPGDPVIPFPFSTSFVAGSPNCDFLSPFDASSTEYGRLGQYANLFHFNLAYNVDRNFGGTAITTYEVRLLYTYGDKDLFGNDIWRPSPHPEHVFYFSLNQQDVIVSAAFSGTFRTRTTAFAKFSIRTQIRIFSGYTTGSRMQLVTLSVFTPNFGTGDASGVPLLS